LTHVNARNCAAEHDYRVLPAPRRRRPDAIKTILVDAAGSDIANRAGRRCPGRPGDDRCVGVACDHAD